MARDPASIVLKSLVIPLSSVYSHWNDHRSFWTTTEGIFAVYISWGNCRVLLPGFWAILSFNGFQMKNRLRLCAMAHTYNPSTLGGRGGSITRSRDRGHPGRHGETPSQKKIAGHVALPVVPATREAEVGELLEPRRRKSQWVEITPLHSSLDNKSETLSQKKKKKVLGTKQYFVSYPTLGLKVFLKNQRAPKASPEER